MGTAKMNDEGLMVRDLGFKVIGKTTERGLFGTKYYFAIRLDDKEVSGESKDRTSTIRVTFDQYCDYNVGDAISVTMTSEDGSYWRFT